MTGATLHQLFRYPVKSMMGEALDTVEVGASGVEGDRIWAVRDEKRGGIRGGKKIPQLMTLAAHTDTPAPTIVAPDGESAVVNEDRIHDWLSEKLDHPVTIWPLVPADQLDHYRRGAPDTDDFEEELRTCLAGCQVNQYLTSRDLKRCSNLSRRRALISMRFRYRL